ncbi:MAG: nucleotidyltransferase [Verrucomicrobia bacterium]|nr:nucleotidyltransferase [Verrucomicrobiota bacterium]
MSLRTEHLARCIETLDRSFDELRRAPGDSIDYEIYRNATVKGFELTIETAGKLLRKALKTYSGTARAVDELSFKDVFRHAAVHALLSTQEVERWFAYRANRNTTAHDYGVKFAEETLVLIPDFLADARRLETTLREKFGHADS